MPAYNGCSSFVRELVMSNQIIWKLPSFHQLESLLWSSCEQNLTALETAYRDAFSQSREWFLSADLDEETELVRVIDFRDGFLGRAGQNCSGRVGLVADSGNAPTWTDGCCPSERYLEKGDAVLDAKTGLLWKKYPEGKMGYEKAVANWLKHDKAMVDSAA